MRQQTEMIQTVPTRKNQGDPDIEGYLGTEISGR